MTLIDDLLDEWEERKERGEVVTPESLCADHPELLDEIKQQIKALLEVSAQFGSGIFGGQGDEETTRFPTEQIELPNRYEIVKLHASGGLGNVYLALDKVLDRPVAIKFLKRADLSDEQLARFEWEAKITGQLEHPGIVPIHSMRESVDTTPCYVMRFIDGKTLQQTVEEFRSSTAKQSWKQISTSAELRRLLQALVTVCNIVSFAHARGIIHRDIKPSNIMLGPFGEILLLDWGIAKPIEGGKFSHAMPGLWQVQETPTEELRRLDSIDSPAFTATGQAIGTPAYASPEQLMGKETATGPTSDVFSIGATLFYILCGKSPVELVGWSTYLEQCQLPYTDLANYLPAHLPKKLQAICRKAIRTQVASRYQTALELGNDIDRYLAREPIVALADSLYERVARAARKHPAMTSGLIAASIVLFVSSILFALVLSSKNEQLTASELAVRQSLLKAQQANDQAMNAMRTMFDGVVLSHFSEKEELNREDREYINKSLEQYYAFANLSGDDRRARAIKAEANYNIARLLHWLSQTVEAIPKAKFATDLYRELYRESNSTETLDDYLEALRLLSEMQTLYEDTDEGIRNAREGIAEVERLFQAESKLDRVSFLDHRSSFYANVSTGFIQQRDWKNAYAQCLLSIDDNEALHRLQPNKLVFMHTLASELSRAAELSVHPELEISPSERLGLANMSIELRQKLLEAEPDIVMSQGNWARAHYARALCYAEDKNTAAALDDLRTAIKYTERLRIRYPLIYEWGNQEVEYRTLAAKMHRAEDDWPEVIEQIKVARDLRLTVDAMTVYIELLTEYCELFPEHTVAPEWLAEMYSRRTALVNDQPVSQGSP